MLLKSLTNALSAVQMIRRALHSHKPGPHTAVESVSHPDMDQQAVLDQAHAMPTQREEILHTLAWGAFGDAYEKFWPNGPAQRKVQHVRGKQTHCSHQDASSGHGQLQRVQISGAAGSEVATHEPVPRYMCPLDRSPRCRQSKQVAQQNRQFSPPLMLSTARLSAARQHDGQ